MQGMMDRMDRRVPGATMARMDSRAHKVWDEAVCGITLLMPTKCWI